MTYSTKEQVIYLFVCLIQKSIMKTIISSKIDDLRWESQEW
jgi:hypothetical protein